MILQFKFAGNVGYKAINIFQFNSIVNSAKKRGAPQRAGPGAIAQFAHCLIWPWLTAGKSGVKSCICVRNVEAVIFQPLPLTKNEKTTADLSSTKFVIYCNQKVTKDTKVAKTTKRRENKSKQSKRQPRQNNFNFTQIICPHKHNGIN